MTPAAHLPTSRRPRRIPWKSRSAALAYGRLQDVRSRGTGALQDVRSRGTAALAYGGLQDVRSRGTATRPNEIWHIDNTVIRLLDGTHVYIQGIINNFSRRILAWRVSRSQGPEISVQILCEAAALLPAKTPAPQVYADSGSENYGAVNDLVNQQVIRRVIAQVDVVFSNSLIEAFWRRAKHAWLLLHDLRSLEDVTSHFTEYVTAHNSVIPHNAFRGQTPDEMYFGTGTDVPARLSEGRRLAREQRGEINKALHCGSCPEASPTAASPPMSPPADTPAPDQPP